MSTEHDASCPYEERWHATMHDGEIEPKDRTGHSMLCPYEERRRTRAAGAAELLEAAAEAGVGG